MMVSPSIMENGDIIKLFDEWYEQGVPGINWVEDVSCYLETLLVETSPIILLISQFKLTNNTASAPTTHSTTSNSIVLVQNVPFYDSFLRNS